MKQPAADKTAAAAAVLSGAAALLIFLPALFNGFVNWDDGLYVYENERVMHPDAGFIGWVFTHSYGGNWHPLTLISHAVDYAIWGNNAFGHHLSSVLIHAVNSSLAAILFFVLAEAAGKAGVMKSGFGAGQRAAAAACAGVLFGLHPIHVESAAWISERKDVLCACFYLLGLISYTGYVLTSASDARKGFWNNRRYRSSVFFFILALLSKPMAVTLPVVLVIIDWFVFRRYSSTKGVLLPLKEKIPFFAAALFAAVITMKAQGSVSAVVSFDEAPLSLRLPVVAAGITGYLGKLVFPVALLPHYPYPLDADFLSPKYFVAGLTVLTVTVFCFFYRKGRSLWAAFWAYYITTLLPVVGIIQVGEQAMADRYAYLPGIVFFWAAGYAAVLLWEKNASKAGRLFAAAGFLGVLLLYGAATIFQISIWKNGETLWSHEILFAPSYANGYINRGDALTELGRLEEALKDLDTAAKLAPYSPDPPYYRGLVHLKKGDNVAAFSDFSRAMSLSSTADYRHYRDRAEAFMRMGRKDEALADMKTAEKLKGY